MIIAQMIQQTWNLQNQQYKRPDVFFFYFSIDILYSSLHKYHSINNNRYVFRMPLVKE